MENNKAKTEMKLNALIKVAQVKQTGDSDFGLDDKTVSYLLIITPKGNVRLNIGNGRYEEIKEIL